MYSDSIKPTDVHRHSSGYDTGQPREGEKL